MAQFKCKMCGGTIETKEGETTCQCEFCGTTQTVPVVVDNNRLTSLHNRSNSLRMRNEFDLAMLTYENIISENPKDAEAHWGLLLCRYGIEYVSDPATGKRIPTCHRTELKSIFDDVDYKAAIENSDVIAKRLYQSEAEEIDRIQKGILAISQKEDPYDIFICYKENDENGKRTKDSVIAQEIYTELTKRKYRVFFSRVTLETKLGSQYEPYIFAALSSAKVMLVIGSKNEYFNAVWVKNEWSRYLAIMNTSGGKKYIIPCYKDMEAYEMPEELLPFQAQDMNKLGFLQDLNRGIDKLFQRETVSQTVPTQPIIQNGVNITALLKRCEILIGDRDYEKANKLLDEVLNNDPENAHAYAYLLAVELRLRSEKELGDGIKPLTEYGNYQKAIRFADNEYKSVLETYNQSILDRIEQNRLQEIYNRGIAAKKNGYFDTAIEIFNGIPNFSDSKKQVELCKTAIIDRTYRKGIACIDKGEFEKAIEIFESVIDYSDAKDKIEFCRGQIADKIYQSAMTCIQDGDFEKAIEIFGTISNYKDSKEKIVYCKEQIKDRIYEKAQKFIQDEQYEEAIHTLEGIEDYRDSKELINTCHERIEKKIEDQYQEGCRLKDNYQYEEALKCFTALKDYKDSEQQIESVHELQKKEYKYASAIKEANGKAIINYDRAIRLLKTIEDYRDSKALIQNYQDNISTIKNKNAVRKDKLKLGLKIGTPIAAVVIAIIVLTFTLFIPLGKYSQALKYLAAKDYDSAEEMLTDLNGFKDSEKQISVSRASRYFDAGDYESGIALIYDIGGTINVKFDSNGGDPVETSVLKKNARQDQLKYFANDQTYVTQTATYAGYDFHGWTMDSYSIDNSNEDYVTEVNLKANWDIITYSISYNLYSGKFESVAPSTYNVETETQLPNPVKTGYTFTGWTEENGSDEPVIDYVIKKGTIGNKYFTAHWQANTYTMYFDAAGGEVSPATQQVVYNDNFTLPTPTRNGYEFTGWYYGSTKMKSGVYKYAYDLYLIAHWNVNDYNIYYTLNGGVGDSSNPSTYTVEDEDILIINPTRTGYTFTGWTGNGYTEPQKTMYIRQGTYGDIFLVANWEANTYTITYEANGGTMESYTQEVVFDESFTLYSTLRSYYEFMGWYYQNKRFYSGKYTIASDITITAEWTPIEYTITYEMNDGINDSSNPTSYNYESGALSIINPTRTGYTFLGWSVNGSDTLVLNYTIETLSHGDLVLTAMWEANQYTVSFDVNGGDNEISAITVTYDSSYSLPTPTKVGYTFLGWYYNEELVSSNSIWDRTYSCTFVAKWSANTSTTYVVNHYLENIEDDGFTLKRTDNLKGTSDSTISPSVYTYSHYVKPSVQTTTIRADGTTVVNYYYYLERHTVTFVSNGGNEISSITQKYGTSIDSTIVATRENYTFSGWYTDIALTEEYDFLIHGEDIKVYAYWAEETLTSEFSYTISNEYVTITKYNGSSTTCWIPEYIGGYIVAKISSGAFDGKSEITTLKLPNEIASIEENAFQVCTGLTTLITPFVGQDIEGGTLASMFSTVPSTLQSVTITKQTSIPGNAFAGCTSLVEVNIPETTTSIGSSAFNGCTSLVKINGSYINLPSTITSIGNYAFQNCTAILQVNLNNMTGTIGAYAFNGCNSLVWLQNWYNLTGSIGQYAFNNCTSLYRFEETVTGVLTIPNNITSIGAYAFANLNRVTDVVIGNQVTSIGASSFSGCSSLYSLTTPFVGTSITTGTLSSIFSTVPTSLNTVKITLQTAIPSKAFDGCSSIVQISIPETTTTIGSYAFNGCTSLTKINGTSINLPSTIASIGSYAFQNCTSITAVNLNDMSGTLGSYAFYKCSSLASIKGWDNLTGSIGDYTFYYCSKLVQFGDNASGSLVIPSNVTSIGKQAFYYLPLVKSLVIGDQVTSIGSGAFYGCSSLASLSIPFAGTTSSSGTLTSIFTTVPTSLKTVTITKQTAILSNAFQNCSSIVTINLLDTTTSIGQYAFDGCTALININGTGINLPTSLETIGQYAFRNCSAITNVVVGDNVTSIGLAAFRGCSSLINITLPFVGASESATAYEAVFGYIFGYTTKADTSSTASTTSSTSFSISAYGTKPTGTTWQYTCRNYKSGNYYYYQSYYYYIPSTLKKVTITKQKVLPEAAFAGDVASKIYIPETTTKIGNYSFCKNTILKDLNGEGINIPSTVTKIGSNAFYGCESIVSITGFKNVTLIDEYAFAKCTSLITLDLEGMAGNMNSHAFRECTSLTSVTGLSNCVFGSAYQFYGCTSLEVVDFGGMKGWIANYTFQNCSKLTTIKGWENVTSIADSAFSGCSLLSYFGDNAKGVLVIPSNVTSIRPYTFKDCALITEIIIGNQVTSIAEGAFQGCNSLVSISLPFVGEYENSSAFIGVFGYIFGYTTDYTTNSSYASSTISADFYNASFGSKPSGTTWQYTCRNEYYNSKYYYCSYYYYIPSTLKKVTITKQTKIPTAAFNGCNISEIILPETTTSIGTYAFQNCTSLTSLNGEGINLPSSVTSIGTYAFANLSLITDITVGENVTSIGEKAFYGCSAVVNITLPFAGTSMSAGTLTSLFTTIPTTLKKVTITKQTEILTKAFQNCSSITEINIPENATGIGSYAFDGCKALVKFNGEGINLPSSITSIGSYAFRNCTPIEIINFGDMAGSIGSYAFYGCTSLAWIKGWDNITSIGSYAFSGCNLLVKFGDGEEGVLVVPNTVTSIGTYAFSNLRLLTSITVGDNVTSIGENAFYGCSALTNITLPFAGTSISAGTLSSLFTTVPTTLKTVTITKQTAILSSAFQNCSNITEINIPEATTAIGSYAFDGCKALVNLNGEGINLPSTITSIGSYAFRNCTAIEIVNFNNAPTSIGSYAFYTCSSLTTISGWDYVRGAIGSYAFYDCSLLSKFGENDTGVLIIPSKVTSIGTYAFRNLRLITDITVDEKVTSIGIGAFYGCSSLVNITLPFVGTSESATYYNAVFGIIFGYTTKADTSSDSSTTSSTSFNVIAYGTKPTGTTWQYSCRNYLYNSKYYYQSYYYYIPSTLKKITITKQTVLPQAAFAGDVASEINIPDTTTEIGSFSFCKNTVLKNMNGEGINLPSTLTIINQAAFYGCKNIVSVKGFKNVTVIYAYAFQGCTSLKALDLEEMNCKIYYCAFSECTSLTSVVGLSNSHFWNTRVFYGCSSLESVDLGGMRGLSTSAFENCSRLTTIKGWENLVAISPYAFSGCSLLSYFGDNEKGVLVIPSNVTSIGLYAFQGCTLITDIIVGDQVTTIYRGAFQGCNSLVNITLPSVGYSESASAYEAVFGFIFGYETSYTTSSSYASSTSSTTFYYSSFGTKPSGTTWQYTCRNYVYNKKYYYQSYYYYIPSTLRKVTITRQTVIPTAAFNGCAGLTEIHFPTGYISANSYAFQNCTATRTNDYEAVASSRWSGKVASSYASGSGTKEDPYVIFDGEDFAYFIQQVNAGNSYKDTYFVITSNINMGGKSVSMIGNETHPFYGHIDGQNHYISNLTVTSSGTYVGLFGNFGGSIKNLAFRSVTITSTAGSGNANYYAGLIGHMQGDAEISNVYVNDTVSISNSGAYYLYAGGIVGYMESGSISNCYVYTTTKASDAVLFAYAGGIAGSIASGSITNCMTSGKITANGSTLTYSCNGYIVGEEHESIDTSTCYSTATMVLYDTSGSVSNADATFLSTTEEKTAAMEKLKAIWDSTVWTFTSTGVSFNYTKY